MCASLARGTQPSFDKSGRVGYAPRKKVRRGELQLGARRGDVPNKAIEAEVTVQISYPGLKEGLIRSDFLSFGHDGGFFRSPFEQFGLNERKCTKLTWRSRKCLTPHWGSRREVRRELLDRRTQCRLAGTECGS